MAYQSKYTGLQIDDILDSVEWKQGKIEDLASIRAGAAKGATALQSYTEKYTGTVTGIKINGVVKSGSGVIDLGTISTTETDPIFSASPAASITEAKKVEWDNKVDKVSGKQLSTEDFTTALKTKLEGLSNYDDTELSNAIETLRGDFDEIVSGDTTTAIKTFNEVIAFLDGLTDTQDLESIIASIEQQIAGKMDKVTLATVATSGSYNDLSNKPTIPSAVTESTVSGWGFTKNAGTYSKPSGGIPKSDLASAVQTSLGKADTALQSYTEQYKGTITGVSANGTSVATSGVANIPAASTSAYGVTKLSSATNSTSTTLAATASAVKAAYDLANSYKGTVTGVKINGTTKNPSSGVVDLGTVITDVSNLATKDEAILKDNTGELVTAQTQALYGGGSVYALPDTANGDEDDVLLSQQSVKTINGETIYGSGDITISGGASDANVQAVDTGDVIDDVAVNYATKAYVDGLVGDINSILESIISGVNKFILYVYGGSTKEYSFDNGMTWEDWLKTSYNVDGWYIYQDPGEDPIIYDPTYGALYGDNIEVRPTDIISKNIKYEIG